MHAMPAPTAAVPLYVTCVSGAPWVIGFRILLFAAVLGHDRRRLGGAWQEEKKDAKEAIPGLQMFQARGWLSNSSAANVPHQQGVKNVQPQPPNLHGTLPAVIKSYEEEYMAAGKIMPNAQMPNVQISRSLPAPIPRKPELDSWVWKPHQVGCAKNNVLWSYPITQEQETPARLPERKTNMRHRCRRVSSVHGGPVPVDVFAHLLLTNLESTTRTTRIK
jgi:hypothetical protein